MLFSCRNLFIIGERLCSIVLAFRKYFSHEIKNMLGAGAVLLDQRAQQAIGHHRIEQMPQEMRTYRKYRTYWLVNRA